VRKPLFIAVQCLTRIPAPSVAPEPGKLAWSAVFYPIVGAALGGLALGIHALLAERTPGELLALLILAVWMLLTGALHEDGLADTADAFGSRRGREGLLRVLKDSRIGTYGTLAVVVALLSRWQALVWMPPDRMAAALLAAAVLPRTGIVLTALLAGPATEGSGGAFARVLGWRHAAGAAAVAAAILLPFAGRLLFGAVGCSLLVAVLAALYFTRRLGGVTGDCLGASEQLQEVAVLVWIAVAA
jgi:adenosylcobinamide-GDP ribazoletransferase